MQPWSNTECLWFLSTGLHQNMIASVVGKLSVRKPVRYPRNQLRYAMRAICLGSGHSHKYIWITVANWVNCHIERAFSQKIPPSRQRQRRQHPSGGPLHLRARAPGPAQRLVVEGLGERGHHPAPAWAPAQLSAPRPLAARVLRADARRPPVYHRRAAEWLNSSTLVRQGGGGSPGPRQLAAAAGPRRPSPAGRRPWPPGRLGQAAGCLASPRPAAPRPGCRPSPCASRPWPATGPGCRPLPSRSAEARARLSARPHGSATSRTLGRQKDDRR